MGSALYDRYAMESVSTFQAPLSTYSACRVIQPGALRFSYHGVLFLGDSAAGISEGTLQPNTMLSDDAAQTERSLLSLAERLMPRRADIHHIAFGHQGAVERLDPLLNWASTRSR